MPKTAICYFGSRGAGLRLYSDIKESLIGDSLSEEVIFLCRSGHVNSSVSNQIKEFQVLGYSSLGELLIFIPRLIWLRRYIRNLVQRERIKRVYFVMPSPIDWFIHHFCSLKGVETVHTIHDAVKHPGDTWPRKRSILWRVKKANFIICFSGHVSEIVRQYSPNTIVRLVQHPFFFPKSAPVSIDRVLPSRYFLFIGRNKSYKGLETFLKAFTSIQTKSILVVAGEGMNDAESLEEMNVVAINKWLTDEEHDSLIANAHVVCLPYLEASQSGVLATAMFYKRHILASNVGGLQQQAKEYDKISWVEPNCCSGLAMELLRLDSSENLYSGSRPTAVDSKRQALSSYLELRRAFLQ